LIDKAPTGSYHPQRGVSSRSRRKEDENAAVHDDQIGGAPCIGLRPFRLGTSFVPRPGLFSLLGVHFLGITVLAISQPDPKTVAAVAGLVGAEAALMSATAQLIKAVRDTDSGDAGD
jgi:hypothetical protein